ncbi:helix-turn-helix domain-containing protein [Streptomyces sp. BE147]|uniref:ArsR/SmtB family transcription factor n=1 Tax=Streptomyces sp. BE147 TaxID=3002524 RepID=UPI002E75AB30|nr:helix-turn-helix domain-containing protein [Streptomyces sp. BE147]MEE1742284.1 helix-turn-helix domain-containing protein [Streptomyces sp. BE147]
MADRPGGTEITELAALKALAQPRRRQILQHLTLRGPATSASLARDLGLNTGATSYHLRELARYGFVEETGPEDPGLREVTASRSAEEAGSRTEDLAARRRRWWRAIPGDRRFPPRSRQTPETRLVMDELNRQTYAEDLALFERLQRGAPEREEPAQREEQEARGAQGAPDVDEWADAFAYSRGSLRLTLPELREFFEEYIALMNRYKRPEGDSPAASRTVHTRLLAFPDPAFPEPAFPDPAFTDPAHPAPAFTDNRTETDA